MAPQYKLTYFNSRGLAEPIRLIFAYAAVKYEDKRFEREQWPATKPTLPLPFGKLPILEWDGNVLCETRAIARYLANEFGLAGKNNLEKAKADMLVDGVGDLFKELGNFRTETDEARKEVLKQKLVEEIVPTALKNFQDLLQKNGTGYFVGDAVTWADLVVLHGIFTLQSIRPNLLEKYAGLKAFYEKISSIANIKQWLEKRPVTEH